MKDKQMYFITATIVFAMGIMANGLSSYLLFIIGIMHILGMFLCRYWDNEIQRLESILEERKEKLLFAYLKVIVDLLEDKKKTSKRKGKK